MSVMNRSNNVLLDPPDLNNRSDGLLKVTEYGDAGLRFAIARPDKGGKQSLDDVARELERYGIAIFRHTQDAENIYFRVKDRQAIWAEYLLLNAGVELRNRLIDPRNAQYAARRTPGWMQRPWAENKASSAVGRRTNGEHSAADRPIGHMWQGLNRTVNWLPKK